MAVGAGRFFDWAHSLRVQAAINFHSLSVAALAASHFGWLRLPSEVGGVLVLYLLANAMSVPHWLRLRVSPSLAHVPRLCFDCGRVMRPVSYACDCGATFVAK